MTYAEASAFLGIKPESVKRQARAKRWPRMLGNDGRALVKVPDLPPGGVREASPEGESPPKILPAPPPDDTRERLAAAETEIRLLRERLTDLTADRDVLRDALARAAASQAEIVRPVESRPGFLARLLGRDR